MIDSELKSKINMLWNKFWNGEISDPLQVIGHLDSLFNALIQKAFKAELV